MSNPSLGEKLIAWATTEPSIHLLVLIGSRARAPDAVAAADAFSDWDFQIATSRPEMFDDGAWLTAPGLAPLAYVNRTGRLGSARKATVVSELGELDLVIIPVDPLRSVAQLVSAGRWADQPPARQALTDLSAVLAGGYSILKGAAEFAGLYDLVAREVSPARLDAAAVRQLAEAFVCDYVFTRRKIDRGELLAAQRWLHHHLAETNFRLRHELRLRHGHISFPDARRLEQLGGSDRDKVTVAALPSAGGLRVAVEETAATHRRLVAALLDGRWQWPDLTPLRLRAE